MSRALTALVDLGSNSVRLMLVRIEPDVGYRVLRDERAQTRLGDGSDAALSDASVAHTVEAVTADEEARLGALAARASLQLRDATVVDVGGRSLQISSIRDREPIPIA